MGTGPNTLITVVYPLLIHIVLIILYIVVKFEYHLTNYILQFNSRIYSLSRQTPYANNIMTTTL